MNRGLLLINLGTPDSTTHSAIARYLNEFLMDKRVIDLPWLLRCLLVKGIILPFRSGKSAEAYKSIWTKKGSPLLYYSYQLTQQLQKECADEYQVALGMRYGKPSIEHALDELKTCEEVIILPLYPQYSSAATGTAIEKALHILGKNNVIPNIKVISHFYQHPAYLHAQSELIKFYLKPNHHLLFSYHGIPERQIIKSGCTQACINDCAMKAEQSCYKAQCYKTSFMLAQLLNLPKEQYSISFQSRLGKTPWIKPYTDELLVQLKTQEINNISIVCPSFVTDCLETLEEIGLRAKEQWQQLGGQGFQLLPSLNSHPLWIEALKKIVQ